MSERVYVLGAGFTRGFYPRAPLLVDNFGIDELKSQYERLPAALGVLDRALSRGNGRVDLELLMTRLIAGMPYDSESDSAELHLVLRDLKVSFQRQLSQALGNRTPLLLDCFAVNCVETGSSCITFNYDDALDSALWKTKALHGLDQSLKVSHQYWHPDGGYGFFCRPSHACVQDSPIYMDRTGMLLLKLHGSVNWRLRRGSKAPYTFDAIMHHEDWLPSDHHLDSANAMIELHLESEPFIVPPVLTKPALVEQPILRAVWSHARRILGKAREVIFLGYSMPMTDVASRLLFNESIPDNCQVRVIDLQTDDKGKKDLRDRYSAAFEGRPYLPGIEFEYDGVVDWLSIRAHLNLPDEIDLPHETGDYMGEDSRYYVHGVTETSSGDLIRVCDDGDDSCRQVKTGESHHGDVPKPARVKGDSESAYHHRFERTKGHWVLKKQGLEKT